MQENNSINIILFGDTHLGEDLPIKPRTNRIRRGEDFFRNFETVLNKAKEQNVDFVVHGGDLFFRSKVHPSIIDRVYQIILNFAQANIPLILVPGNHERSRLPTSLLLQHPNIFIFSQPEVFVFSQQNIAFAGFPFFKGNIRDQYAQIQETLLDKCAHISTKIMCFHHPVEGCKVNSGKFTFRNRQDTIQINDLSDNFDAYFSGHIHPSQILYKQSTNYDIPIIYPGSTEKLSFAEKNEIKGYFTITINQNTNPKIVTKFNTLQSRPMVDIFIKNQVSLEKTIDYLVEKLSKVEERSIVRIDAENAEHISQIKTSFLATIAPKDCIISYRTNFFKTKLS